MIRELEIVKENQIKQAMKLFMVDLLRKFLYLPKVDFLKRTQTKLHNLLIRVLLSFKSEIGIYFAQRFFIIFDSVTT